MAIIPVRITLRNHRYKSTLRKRNNDNLTSVKVSKSKPFQPNPPQNRVLDLACTFRDRGTGGAWGAVAPPIFCRPEV